MNISEVTGICGTIVKALAITVESSWPTVIVRCIIFERDMRIVDKFVLTTLKRFAQAVVA